VGDNKEPCKVEQVMESDEMGGNRRKKERQNQNWLGNKKET
jgi:hypothetical protein